MVLNKLVVAGTEAPRRVMFARFGDTWLGEDNNFKVQTITVEKANAPEIKTDEDGWTTEHDVYLVYYVLRDGVNKQVKRTFVSVDSAVEFVTEFLTRIGVEIV